MSGPIARRIIEVLGPCRVLHVGGHGANLLVELLLTGCDAWATGDVALQHPRWIAPNSAHHATSGAQERPFDAIVVDLAHGASIGQSLMPLVTRFGMPATLVLLASGQPRLAYEGALFNAGWRRHPGGLRTFDYPDLSDTALGEISFYQRIPDDAAARWSVADLQIERGLHMDMLRESGCRADAHIVRYALAAEHVRAGDTVLDCACGLGYGTAVLASLSAGGAFIGVDVDAATVAYAEANYGRADVSFRTSNAAALEGIADASVDVVVSMETIEHVEDWHAAVAAFRRVLKPDGRLIASVPDRWMDETGEDPNPHHFHVFDWAKLEAGLSDNFIIESRYVQMAPGGFKLPAARRVLRQVDLDSNEDSEWVLVVASANPFEADESKLSAFIHPAFGPALAASGAAVVDFAGGYDNPYLYRLMVQMGERLRNESKLARLALLVANHGRPGSADQGAAICVLGYQALKQHDNEAAAELMDHLRRYQELTAGEHSNPHVIRWRISLAFLAGKLSELCGDAEQALQWYDAAAHGDWRNFSPLLATKAVAGAFCAGRLHLMRGDMAAAEACFARGLAESLAAIRSDPRSSVGDLSQPIPFGLTELAEVADMGSQCANAIANLPLWKRDPGLFWRQVDVKRFGLVTWLTALERENTELRQRLGAA